MEPSNKSDDEPSKRLPRKPYRQFVLGQAQILSATICLYFLVTTGPSRKTYISGVVALLVLVLSLSFKLKPRR